MELIPSYHACQNNPYLQIRQLLPNTIPWSPLKCPPSRCRYLLTIFLTLIRTQVRLLPCIRIPDPTFWIKDLRIWPENFGIPPNDKVAIVRNQTINTPLPTI